MKTRWSRACVVLPIVAWLAGFILNSPARAGFYSIVDLGTFPNGSMSQGLAINNFGKVAGSADVPILTSHAFVGGPGPNSLVDLQTLPGGRVSQGYGINNAGIVVGESQTTSNVGMVVHAFKGNTPGGLADIGVLPGWVSSHGRGINDAGEVVGFGTLSNGITVAFVTSTTGSIAMLPTLGGSNAVANDINNLGMIVGSSETSVAGKTHAFLITPGGGMTDLGGLPNGDGTSFGLAVNDLGRVVGYGGAAGSNFAFRSLADGTLVNLNTLPGTTSSVAYGINNLNQVVGSASDAAGFSRAFLYTDAAGLVDLNSLIDRSSGWVLTSAHGINDSGQIVGNGLFQGQARAFVLTPSGVIPEPTSFLLLGLGLSALGIVWARRGSAGQSLAPSQD